MCGIVGMCRADPEQTVDRSLIERMCRSIRHRGPDDQGISVEGRVGLGMRRLSIIDLVTGDQPMGNEDGSITVVFNGEIYNFQELRETLITRGHRFKTRSDTEVIVHLYEEHGDACVELLRGMFVFALWDRKLQKLFVARDRLGVKPLFYRHDPQGIAFGSEIKALLQDPAVERAADPVGIDQMLTFGYTVPPRTCFRQISELPQASTLTYTAGHVSIRRYWDLRFEDSAPYDEKTALERVRSLLGDAVRLRMISDVPLGALLSGGIDSSIIVALMSELSDEPVKTFSIGFDDPSFSELPLARQTARLFGTDHHELVVKPDVAELLPTLVRHHDAPFYDCSALPTYYVCKMAREHVTVALSGDGGDELFAGYNLYRADKAARYYRRVPGWLRDGVITPLTRLVPESTAYINKGRVLREFTRAAALDSRERHARWGSKIKEETRRRLYRDPALRACLDAETDAHHSELFRRQPGATDLGRMLYADINSVLVNDMLVKVDRMSMAVSLEVRSPLLDHHLFEFAATLPDRAKIKGWTSKYLLKKLAAEVLPRELLNRPKRGFLVPLDRWFREELADYAREMLFDPACRGRGLFDPRAVEAIVEDHVAGRKGYGREIWNLLTLELWHRMYIDSFDYVETVGAQ